MWSPPPRRITRGSTSAPPPSSFRPTFRRSLAGESARRGSLSAPSRLAPDDHRTAVRSALLALRATLHSSPARARSVLKCRGIARLRAATVAANVSSPLATPANEPRHRGHEPHTSMSRHGRAGRCAAPGNADVAVERGARFGGSGAKPGGEIADRAVVARARRATGCNAPGVARGGVFHAHAAHCTRAVRTAADGFGWSDRAA
jgi:hypothetical protein